MTEINGTVEAVKQRSGGYGLLLNDGNWYDGWGSAAVRKGEQVAIGFALNTKNGTTYRNISFVRKAGPVQTGREQPNEAGRRIMRAVALKAACTFLQGSSTDHGEVLKLAELFASWLPGQANNGEEASASASASTNKEVKA